jgi:hypothetical protein
MGKLSDDEVKDIAKRIATSHNIRWDDVQTRNVVDSEGVPTREIKFILTPGSTTAVLGLPTALTTSDVMGRLAAAGEELPIVRYEERRGATSES